MAEINDSIINYIMDSKEFTDVMGKIIVWKWYDFIYKL